MTSHPGVTSLLAGVTQVPYGPAPLEGLPGDRLGAVGTGPAPREGLPGDHLGAVGTGQAGSTRLGN